MPRTARQAPGGHVYHALHRGTARPTPFRKPADYDAFRRVLGKALERYPTRPLAVGEQVSCTPAADRRPEAST